MFPHILFINVASEERTPCYSGGNFCVRDDGNTLIQNSGSYLGAFTIPQLRTSQYKLIYPVESNELHFIYRRIQLHEQAGLISRSYHHKIMKLLRQNYILIEARRKRMFKKKPIQLLHASPSQTPPHESCRQ